MTGHAWRRLARGVVMLSPLLLAAGCGAGEEATPGPERPSDAGPSGDAPSGTPEPAGTAGITGSVVYEGEVPDLRPLNLSADPDCAAKHDGPVKSEVLVLGEGNTLANVLVHVKNGLPDRPWPAPSGAIVMDQRGCRYSPRVMGLRVGQTFRILNSDRLLHNVHALPKVNREFNMAMPATRTEAEQAFTKAEEPFRIKCDVHPWMGAYVAVMEHPFFSVTDASGKFSIAGLPAGSYELEAWHERLDARGATVTLGDAETKTVDFIFTR